MSMDAAIVSMHATFLMDSSLIKEKKGKQTTLPQNNDARISWSRKE